LAWQVLALSVGAIFLLMTMIKQGATASVGSYFLFSGAASGNSGLVFV
jgi:hypothetical protein